MIIIIQKNIKTCHYDRFAKVFQHEGQGRAGVGEGVRPVEDDKPDDVDDDDEDDDDDDSDSIVIMMRKNITCSLHMDMLRRGKSQSETKRTIVKYDLGTPSKKYVIIWEFFPTWGGGGLPNSQNQKPKKKFP